MYGCPRAVAPLALPSMRTACQGLAAKLASSNRRLNVAEKELNALKRLDKPT